MLLKISKLTVILVSNNNTSYKNKADFATESEKTTLKALSLLQAFEESLSSLWDESNFPISVFK